jgi:hypothetical protein
LSGLSYGQLSIDTININQLGYDPVELGNNTSEILQKMTEEEKVWFNSTFIYRRGQFKIPLIFEGVKRTISKNVQKKNLLKLSKTLTDQPNTRSFYSTVTDFAKFLGWSTLQPRITAIK